MKVVKLLERKEVIRLFGAGLLLAPFINNFISLWLLPDEPSVKWTFAMFVKVASAGVLFQQILDAFSLIIGVVLLSGSTKAWRFVLIFLGGYISMQVMYLGKNLRANPLSGVFFLTNIALFIFIADQIVWKQKRSQAPAKKPQPPPQFPLNVDQPTERSLNLEPEIKAPVQHSRAGKKIRQITARKSLAKIMVHFQDYGPWAHLSAISTDGLEVKANEKVPPQIESRVIEIQLGKDLHLKARFAHRHGPHYFFAFDPLSKEKIQKLNSWLLRQAG